MCPDFDICFARSKACCICYHCAASVMVCYFTARTEMFFFFLFFLTSIHSTKLGPRIIPYFRDIVDECVNILREGIKGKSGRFSLSAV